MRSERLLIHIFFLILVAGSALISGKWKIDHQQSDCGAVEHLECI